MKIGRIYLCPCGSGKKYKKCCLAKIGLKNVYVTKSTRDSDFGFVIESVEVIEYEEKLERELDSQIEIALIQQELFQDRNGHRIEKKREKPKRKSGRY